MRIDVMFEEWLQKSTTLSDNSIYKYIHAVTTVSYEMMARNVISKPMIEMELYELDLAISLIFKDSYFLTKNRTGNNMYSNALKWFRSFVQANVLDATKANEEEKKIKVDSSLTITEREAVIKSRIGQGSFREKLLQKYGSCIITGIDIPRLLIASHIKPWAVSSNIERVSENNGLLLSATYDRLFDSGLISFAPGGRLLVSKTISDANKDRLKIRNGEIYHLYENNEVKTFLEYHNDVVFIK